MWWARYFVREDPGARPSVLVGQVAAEIAFNHNKHLRPEFLASSFGELGTAMTQLGFAPIRPRRLSIADYRLVGARYCSIGSSMAAQIRLAGGAGRSYTLYELRADEPFESIEEADLEIDGVGVSLWRESGLLIALARSRE